MPVTFPAMSIDSQIEDELIALRANPAALLERFDRNGDGELDEEEWAAVRATVARDILGMSSNCPEVTLRQRYRLISSIGHGAQGQTFLAHDLHTQQLVAVKTLHVKLAKEWKAIDLFEREAKTLSRLEHPGIPAFIDAFDEGDGTEFYLVQEFVPGDNLEVRLARGEMFNTDRLERLARRTLEILSYLHSQSPPVLHRDIKPANLILGKDDRVSLVDFGAVQNQGSRGTTIIGTTGYMPPEQLAGRATPASDLYALAATLVHVATRCHPADLPVERLKLQWRRRGRLPEGFSSWLDLLLDPDVEKRPPNAKAALADLDRADQLALLKPTAIAAATLPPRNIVLNTPPVMVGRVTMYRINGDLLIDDEEFPLQSLSWLILVVMGLGGVFVLKVLGVTLLIFIVMIVVGLWGFFTEKVPVKSRISKEQGLTVHRGEKIQQAPFSAIDQAVLELSGRRAGIPSIKIRSGKTLRLSRRLGHDDADRIVHEVRVWILENRDE